MPVSEFELIKRYFTRGDSQPGVVLGVGDDAAIIRVDPGYELVVAADVLNEGIHFPSTTSANAIGYKSLAVNLSDLAAMGATPLWFTMTLSLPDSNEDWLNGFSSGLFEIGDRYGISLIGGDTVRGPLSVGVQVIGKVKPGTALRRDGARVGDLVYVSGSLGDAAGALEQMKAGKEPAAELKKRLDYPTPRIELGLGLVGIASSCIDISDGLLADLKHILDASRTGARIGFDSLPVSESLSALAAGDAKLYAANGGDDYELCFTVPPNRTEQAHQLAQDLDCPVTCIGEITGGDQLVIEAQDAVLEKLTRRGFDHFQNKIA